MRPFCEVIAFDVLPAVRGMVARQLMDMYGISQKRAALMLGISQPAVSQYKNDLRGRRLGVVGSNPGIKAMVEDIAERMAAGEIDGMESTLSFCGLCKELRFSGAGCELCMSRNPGMGDCNLCQDNKDFFGQPPKPRQKGRIKILSKFQ